MKFLLSLTLLASVGTAFAGPILDCPQAATRFEEVLASYDTCSARGANCASFCSDANLLLGPAPGGVVQGCTPNELQAARTQGRQEVLRDLSATQTVTSGDYYGINHADCSARAASNIQPLVTRAQEECNRKAITIKNCRVIGGPRITGSAGSPPRIEASERVEIRASGSDEATCRQSAIRRAQTEALARCERAVGAACTLTRDNPTSTYRVDRNPFGSDKRVCNGTAWAQAPADITYRCRAEVTAVNQAVGF